MFQNPNIAFIITIPKEESPAKEEFIQEEFFQGNVVQTNEVAENSQTNTTEVVVVDPLIEETAEEMEEGNTLPIALFLTALGIYLAVIGPVDFFLVRLLKRPWLTWVTFPFWIILFTCVFYAMSLSIDFSDAEAGEQDPTTFQSANTLPRS